MKFVTPLVILLLLALSGFADSLGFVYSPKIWRNGVVSWRILAKSALRVLVQQGASGKMRGPRRAAE
jgi:hypothetical protein